MAKLFLVSNMMLVYQSRLEKKREGFVSLIRRVEEIFNAEKCGKTEKIKINMV